MDADTRDHARHEVLAENTAQAVHKHLSKLFQEEARFRSRWIWELLQNARDASPPEGVSVRLIHDPHRVVFSHSGVPFSYKSIAHLIYHGSTKYDLDNSGAIGQFGTGFLTTHLISKTVTVKGRTEDGGRFCFLLDRRGDSADKLKRAMDSSWEAFSRSLAESGTDDRGYLPTEYEYPLSFDVVDVVNAGVTDLVANAAYLLAFNGRIRSLRIERPDNSITIDRKADDAIGELAQRFHFHEHSPVGNSVSRCVATISDRGTTVAIEIVKMGDVWSVVERGHGTVFEFESNVDR